MFIVSILILIYVIVAGALYGIDKAYYKKDDEEYYKKDKRERTLFAPSDELFLGIALWPFMFTGFILLVPFYLVYKVAYIITLKFLKK